MVRALSKPNLLLFLLISLNSFALSAEELTPQNCDTNLTTVFNEWHTAYSTYDYSPDMFRTEQATFIREMLFALEIMTLDTCSVTLLKEIEPIKAPALEIIQLLDTLIELGKPEMYEKDLNTQKQMAHKVKATSHTLAVKLKQFDLLLADIHTAIEKATR